MVAIRGRGRADARSPVAVATSAVKRARSRAAGRMVLALARGFGAGGRGEPGIVVRTGQSQGLVKARHAAADFTLADAQVTRDLLVGQVALDQAQQLELGSLQGAPQLSSREAVYPGWPCHRLSVTHFGLLRLFHLACKTPATSAAVLTQPKN